jgi:signal transduction histidine kinase/CheY-like chemotaxis protein
MNLPAAIALVAAGLGFAVSALSLAVGSSRRWAQCRLLSLTAAFASLFCAAEIATVLSLSPASLIAIMRFQGVFGVLHVLMWQLYADRHLGQLPSRPENVLRGITVALAATWLVPGLTLDGTTETFDVAVLRATYQYPQVTALGAISFLAELGWLILVLVRYAIAARRRSVDGALVHALALGAIFVTGAHDICVAFSVYKAPFFISIGFIASVGVVGVILGYEFVRDARDLDAMKERLEQIVETRTRELVQAEAALMRSEKLAALGQLSAGVAHEINNPAAAVGANIQYLRQELAGDQIPADALECLDDSLDAVGRIAKIVRQMLDVGRSATKIPTSGAAAKLDRAVHHAIASSRSSAGSSVLVTADLEDNLFAVADEDALVQILVNLIVNGAQAIPEGRANGRVTVHARRHGDVVRIRVVDNGRGMSDETKRRLFEPFYTTKPVGQGTGLGLSVCLALVRSFGGDLEVESRPGETTMKVELRWTPAPEERLAVRTLETGGGRRSLLLVEDDDRVRRALARTLGCHFDVDLAAGVDAALDRLRHRTFDVVLSDWKMPDGGGRRLLDEIAAEQPDTVRSLYFVTGGKLSDDDEALLARHRSVLLRKPFAVDTLLTALRAAEAADETRIRPPGREVDRSPSVGAAQAWPSGRGSECSEPS